MLYKESGSSSSSSLVYLVNLTIYKRLPSAVTMELFMKRSFSTLIIFLAFLTMIGCAPKSQFVKTHYSLNSPKELPKKVLILPVDVDVYELGLSSLELVPEWSEKAELEVQNAFDIYSGKAKEMEFVSVTDLTEHEKSEVDDFLSLYRIVAANAMVYTGPTGWPHKRAKFDYTMGPSLNFLKERTGVDTVLIVSGFDQISTGSRKATQAAATILLAVLGVGYAPQGGTAFLYGSAVDLDTGNLLWVNYAASQSHDMTKKFGAQSMLYQLMEGHPHFPNAPRAERDTPTGAPHNIY